MALTTEQLSRQATQQSAAKQVFVDSRQQAIDAGYRPGSGVMYNDKFYESLNPGRQSMDASPIDMLMQTDPEFARRYQAGEFETVMNPNQIQQTGTPEYFTADYDHLQGPKPIRPGEPGSPGYPGTQGGSSINQGPGGLLPSIMPEFITGGNGQLPGPIMDPNITPFDPQPSMPDFNTGTGINTTDIFGVGNNPINNNPIAPMPSPITPPPGMDSGHSHDDLLSGIGKLFEQYFPQRGGTSTPSATQPVFDAVGNSAPPQVFGNMITPFGRQG